MGTLSCILSPSAKDNGIRDGRSNDLSYPPTYTGQYPLSFTYFTVQCGLQITRLAATSEDRTSALRNASPMHCLCCHSGYSCSGGASVRNMTLTIQHGGTLGTRQSVEYLLILFDVLKKCMDLTSACYGTN